jgi:hypothetical protein
VAPAGEPFDECKGIEVADGAHPNIISAAEALGIAPQQIRQMAAGTRPVPERHIPDCRVASPTELRVTRFFNHLQLQTGITDLLKLKGFFGDLQTSKLCPGSRRYSGRMKIAG